MAPTTMSEHIQSTDDAKGRDAKGLSTTTADESKLNAIGYEQEFKRDMSAAG